MKLLEIFNLKDKLEYLDEVAGLEYNEWADNKEINKEKRSVLYLKTNLENYYEKFGAIFIKNLKSGEHLYKFEV